MSCNNSEQDKQRSIIDWQLATVSLSLVRNYSQSAACTELDDPKIINDGTALYCVAMVS